MNRSGKNLGAESTKHRADERALTMAPAIRAALASGAESHATVAAWLNKNEVPTARGGNWQPGSVHRLRMRLAALDESAPAVRSRSEAQCARIVAKRRQAAADREATRRQWAEQRALRKLGVLHSLPSQKVA